jgi:hypothetical protein
MYFIVPSTRTTGVQKLGTIFALLVCLGVLGALGRMASFDISRIRIASMWLSFVGATQILKILLCNPMLEFSIVAVASLAMDLFGKAEWSPSIK